MKALKAIIVLSILLMGCGFINNYWVPISGITPAISYRSAHFKCAGEIKGSPFIRGTALMTKSKWFGYDEYLECMEHYGWMPMSPTDTDKGDGTVIKKDELWLARAGEKAFKNSDYEAAKDYLNRARTVSVSGVWQSNYPYLAGAYWHLGKEEEAKKVLVEMLTIIYSDKPSYLYFESPLGFVTNSLLYARNTFSADNQQYWNSVITEVTDHRIKVIRRNVRTGRTYSPSVETSGIKSGGELWYCRKGNKAFMDGDYNSALEYYNSARSTSTSGVWQSSYPYLAGSHWHMGDKNKSKELLDEMLKITRADTPGYLNSETTLGFLTNSLLNVRKTIPADEQDVWDSYIDAVTERRIEVIRKDVSKGRTY